MKVNAKMKYLGYEEGTTRDGKPYQRCGLLQGFKAETIYLNNDTFAQVKQLKPMTDVDCELDISIGERTFINLVNIVPEK